MAEQTREQLIAQAKEQVVIWAKEYDEALHDYSVEPTEYNHTYVQAYLDSLREAVAHLIRMEEADDPTEAGL